jgi:hypothetical protein
MYRDRYRCPLLTESGVSRQIFLPSVLYLTKIRPVGAALIHADRQTDRHEEANRLLSLLNANAPKNCL